MLPSAPRIVVLTAPSGAGKTSIANRILRALPNLRFSVSATTRPARDDEQDGVEYHFVTNEEFRRAVENDQLLEHEEVYPGRWYGTLRSETDNASRESPVLLDIDVRGATNVKRIYGSDALVIFVAPPSIEVLEERLRRRGTESDTSLETRLETAKTELEYAHNFDAVVVNDDLDSAAAEALAHIKLFFSGWSPEDTF